MNFPITTIGYIVVLLLINYLVYIKICMPLLYRFMSAARLIGSGVRVKGRVVGHVEKPSVDQEIHYAPIVKFTDHEGVTRNIASETYESKERIINSRINVYYDENDRDDILVDNGMVLASRLISLLFLGIAWIILNVTAVECIFGVEIEQMLQMYYWQIIKYAITLKTCYFSVSYF